jgi:hypothetical protein
LDKFSTIMRTRQFLIFTHLMTACLMLTSCGKRTDSAKKQEKNAVPFFDTQRKTIKADAKKASEEILSLVESNDWTQAQKIYTSAQFGWPEKGLTPDAAPDRVLVGGGEDSGLVTGRTTITFNPRQDFTGGKFSSIEFITNQGKQNMGLCIDKNQFLDDLFEEALAGPLREHNQELITGLAQRYATVVNKVAYSKSIENQISSTESKAPAILGFEIGQDLGSFLDKALERSDLISWHSGRLKDSYGPCIAFACMTMLFDKPMIAEFKFCPTLSETKKRMVLSHWKLTFTPDNRGAFQNALDEAGEACKRSQDALDRARLLESLSKFGIRNVTDGAIQKNNAEALESGLKMIQGFDRAMASRGNGSDEVNDVDRNFLNFTRSRSKDSQVYEEQGTIESDVAKVRLKSRDRGTRMTTTANQSKKLFFVMSESTYEEALDRIREDLLIYRIGDTRIFESKQKTGVPDTFSSGILDKEVSISGGDESHLFKIETISTIVDFVKDMQLNIEKYQSKDKSNKKSLNALGG